MPATFAVDLVGRHIEDPLSMRIKQHARLEARRTEPHTLYWSEAAEDGRRGGACAS
jgi:hypothetical protein